MRPNPKHTRISRGLTVALAVAVTGLVAPAATAAPRTPAPSPSPAATTTSADASALRLGLPRVGIALRAAAADARAHLPAGRPLIDLIDEWRTCERTTPVSTYVARQSSRLTGTDQLVMAATFADRLPMWEAQMRAAGDPRVALTDHAAVLADTLARLKGFWDVDGSRIEMVGMSGTMLTDPARVQAVYEQVLGFSPALAQRYAAVVVHWARTSPGIDGGRNPVLTFNAFAIPATEGKAPRIVMGEGMLRAYDELGHGSFGAQLVLAHEYGHQVQFAQHWTPFVLDVRGIEAVELHADASAGYFATHATGLAASASQVATVEQAFHGIGDCAIILPGHHGTPAQRSRAATWGVQQAVADGQQRASAATFRSRFATALPARILPNPKPVARH